MDRIQIITDILRLVEDKQTKLDLLTDFMYPHQALFIISRYDSLSPGMRTEENVRYLVKQNLQQITRKES